MNNEQQTQLIARLEAQEQKYTVATDLIQKLAAADNLASHTQQQQLTKLQRLLAEIRRVGADVQLAAETWDAAGRPRSPSFTAALSQQEQKVAEFIEQINQLAGKLDTGRTGLKRRIDAGASHKTMHAAYQRSMRSR